MVKPTFSVIIPTLNEEKFLPFLLTSLTAQSNKDFEVIVVDGKSKDNTLGLAKTFFSRLPKLSLVESSKASLPLQRNIGAKRAIGDWFVFVDADSVLMPYFIDRVLKYIQTHQPSAFTTWTQPDSISNTDAIFALFTNVYFEATLQFKRPFTPGPLSVIRKDIFFNVGGYDESHSYNEDVEFGLRLHRLGIPVTIIREVLYTWSMRRMRHEGKMKVIQQYALSLLPIFFQRPLKHMPGYEMGGQLYTKKKRIKSSVFKSYERKLKRLMQEFFT